MKTIVDVIEVLTDEDEVAKEWFELKVVYEDGTDGLLRFSLKGGRIMQEMLDCIPEIRGEHW